MGRTEKACASKEAYKPDSVTPALLGGMAQIINQRKITQAAKQEHINGMIGTLLPQAPIEGE